MGSEDLRRNKRSSALVVGYVYFASYFVLGAWGAAMVFVKGDWEMLTHTFIGVLGFVGGAVFAQLAEQSGLADEIRNSDEKGQDHGK